MFCYYVHKFKYIPTSARKSFSFRTKTMTKHVEMINLFEFVCVIKAHVFTKKFLHKTIDIKISLFCRLTFCCYMFECLRIYVKKYTWFKISKLALIDYEEKKC